jgi:hypothetical protein
MMSFDVVCMRSDKIEVRRKPSVFLYVPFSDQEGGDGLQLMALNWRKAIRESAQPGKVVLEVIFHGDDTFDKVPEGSIIYILAHGVPGDIAKFTDQDLTDHVCNTADKREEVIFYLNMQEVVNRLMSDRLKPGQAAKIKIYVCEEGIAQTKKISEKLIEALGTDFGNTDVYNYTRQISVPQKTSQGMHKHAVKVTFEARHRPKVEFFGRASDFRKVSNVAKFFEQKSEKPHTLKK